MERVYLRQSFERPLLMTNFGLFGMDDITCSGRGTQKTHRGSLGAFCSPAGGGLVPPRRRRPPNAAHPLERVPLVGVALLPPPRLLAAVPQHARPPLPTITTNNNDKDDNDHVCGRELVRR